MTWLLAILLSVFLVGGFGSESSAYPDKPIKAIIGQEAGSATDLGARAIFQIREKDLGQPFMVINKPGGAAHLVCGKFTTPSRTGIPLEPAVRSMF